LRTYNQHIPKHIAYVSEMKQCHPNAAKRARNHKGKPGQHGNLFNISWPEAYYYANRYNKRY
jgi:hypothetical protein